MYVFKKLEESDVTIRENKLHYQQNLTNDSDGLSSIQYRSGSIGSGSFKTQVDTSGSQWNFLHSNLYQSSSALVNTDETSSFYSPWTSWLYVNPVNPQHRNKFYSSGSIFSIPNYYTGDTIKRGTFVLTDLSHSSSIDNTINPIIKDDGWGNLYATNAYNSQSSDTSISSSENYVGNIIYEYGLVTLTETSSWSGSVNYTDLGTNNYSIDFKSTHTVYTMEIDVEIRGDEFNNSLNPTSRGVISGSFPHTESPYMIPDATGSLWTPYITKIMFYDSLQFPQVPKIVASLSKPLQKLDDVTYRILVQIDL